MNAFVQSLCAVAQEDLEGLVEARRLYGDSWRAEGGFSAFFNIKRKIDRFVKCLNRSPVDIKNSVGSGVPDFTRERYDLFGHIQADIFEGGEATLDSIRDLRRYLLLAEAWMVEQNTKLPRQRDNLSLDSKSVGAIVPGIAIRVTDPSLLDGRNPIASEELSKNNARFPANSENFGSGLQFGKTD